MSAPNSDVPRYADAPRVHLTTSAENVDDSERKPDRKRRTSSECNPDWFQTDQSLPDHNQEAQCTHSMQYSSFFLMMPSWIRRPKQLGHQSSDHDFAEKSPLHTTIICATTPLGGKTRTSALKRLLPRRLRQPSPH
jgi:hypothetical protein